jgi:hypothetical protein
MLFSWKIIFVIFTGFVNLCFLVFTEYFLRVYKGYFFPSLRYVYDSTIGLVPFPPVYALFLIICFLLLIKFVKWWPYKREIYFSYFYKKQAVNIFKNLLLLICLFYWFWGFLYYQKSFISKSEYMSMQVSPEYLQKEIQVVSFTLNEWRKEIGENEIKILSTDGMLSMEKQIRVILEKTLKKQNLPSFGNVRVRALGPEGILLGLSTAGIYIPFVFEGHIDKGLHSLQYPFTMAHEMAHGYGITDEGDCNALALLVCLQSHDKAIRYAGLLTYFRYLKNDSRNKFSDEYFWKKTLSPEVVRDLMEIKNQVEKFPDILPFWRDYIYESYLVWMGIEDGLKSYFTVIDKVAFLKSTQPQYFTIITNR